MTLERDPAALLLGLDDPRPGFLCECGALVLRTDDDDPKHPEPVCEWWTDAHPVPPKRDTEPSGAE